MFTLQSGECGIQAGDFSMGKTVCATPDADHKLLDDLKARNKEVRFIYPAQPNEMPYDLEESKCGEVIHAKSWAGGIACSSSPHCPARAQSSGGVSQANDFEMYLSNLCKRPSGAASHYLLDSYYGAMPVGYCALTLAELLVVARIKFGR